MAKKKLYGAALAAHEKKMAEQKGKKGKKSKPAISVISTPPKTKKSYKFSFGEVNEDDFDSGGRAYWSQYAKEEAKNVAPANLKSYPTPAAIHKEITYYRPLTKEQKTVKAAYDKWVASKPSKPLTKEEQKQKADEDFKAAYERWQVKSPVKMPLTAEMDEWLMRDNKNPSVKGNR